MESDKGQQNRVPAINDIAVTKETHSKPVKGAKAEKNSKNSANVKVVDVMLKQPADSCSPKNAPSAPKNPPSPQVAASQLVLSQPPPNSKPIPNEAALDRLSASSGKLESQKGVPQSTCQPVIIPPNVKHEPVISQPLSSQPVTNQPPSSCQLVGNHQPSSNDVQVNQSLDSNKPVINQPLNPSQPVVNLPLLVNNQSQLNGSLPASVINSQNLSCPVNQQPAAAPAQSVGATVAVPAAVPKQSAGITAGPLASVPKETVCATATPQATVPIQSVGATVALPAPVVNNHVPVQSVPLPPASTTVTKVHKHKDKKEDKSVNHVLKALNSLNTTDEKLAALCKKYADLFDENRKLQLLVKQSEKKVQLIHREKEQLQTEHSKAILTRSRLENLCRELQKQNKAIKEDSITKMREEEEKRTEISAKFQSTLSEITALMQQNNDKNNKLRDDNIDMTSRLKSVCEQYQLREQQVEKLSKQMELEVQLCDAKLTKAKMEMTAEKEILLREKQQLLLELQTYQTRCQELQSTEVDLRNQIALYNNKYDEFQQALSKSNQVFSNFKLEMEKMSKKMTKLEKETSTWKKRWEQSHQAVLEMAVDKQVSDQELKKTSRQLEALQGLCRTLQTERAELLETVKKLSGEGIVDLSQEGKVSTVDASPEAIEKLMTKIENESRITNAEGGKLKSDEVSNAAEKSDTGVLIPPAQPAIEVATVNSCEKTAVVLSESKISCKNQSNIKSKKDTECDSSNKTTNSKQDSSGRETTSTAAGDTSSCQLLISAPPVEAADQGAIVKVHEKGENDSKANTSSIASHILPKIGGGGDEVPPTASSISQPSITESVCEITPKAAPKPVLEDKTTVASDVANKEALLRSDSKPEIVGSVLKIGAISEKTTSKQPDCKETTSLPSNKAINACDKKDMKPIPEQKKKESAKKRKK